MARSRNTTLKDYMVDSYRHDKAMSNTSPSASAFHHNARRRNPQYPPYTRMRRAIGWLPMLNLCGGMGGEDQGNFVGRFQGIMD